MRIVFVIAAIVGGLTGQLATNTCPVNAPYVSRYALVPGSFSQSASICNSVYSQWGTCVNQTNTTNTLRNITSTFRFGSLNEFQYVQLLTNMTIYWKAVNGFINGPIAENNTLLNSISQAWSSDRNWSAETPAWLLQAQRNANSSIQACHEAYANISVGLWCSITSGKTLNSTENAGPQSKNLPFTFLTSSPEIGAQLESCIPLLDVYCMNSYGVSVTNSALPFNTTFNFSDNTVPLTTCLAMQNLTNATDGQSVATRQAILIGMFNTLRIVYSPTYDSLKNVAYFLLAGKANTTFTVSNRTLSVSPGAKVAFDPTAENLTFYTYGRNSNISGYIYGDSGTEIWGLGLAALVAYFVSFC